MAEVTTLQIPILLRENYGHVMGTGELTTEGNDAKFIFSVTASGVNAQDLVDFLTSGLPVALQIIGIPVTPRTTKSKENI